MNKKGKLLMKCRLLTENNQLPTYIIFSSQIQYFFYFSTHLNPYLNFCVILRFPQQPSTKKYTLFLEKLIPSGDLCKSYTHAENFETLYSNCDYLKRELRGSYFGSWTLLGNRYLGKNHLEYAM